MAHTNDDSNQNPTPVPSPTPGITARTPWEVARERWEVAHERTMAVLDQVVNGRPIEECACDDLEGAVYGVAAGKLPIGFFDLFDRVFAFDLPEEAV